MHSAVQGWTERSGTSLCC